jgi:hypothetical protein
MRQSARDLARMILEDKTVQEQLLLRARRGELPASVLTRFLPYWSGPPPTTPQEREPAERKNQSLSEVIKVLTSEEQKQFFDLLQRACSRLTETIDETPPGASR